jgi:hypothetical protein
MVVGIGSLIERGCSARGKRSTYVMYRISFPSPSAFQAVTNFQQYWMSNNYADQGPKVIHFIKSPRSSQWEIAHEEMLSSERWDRNFPSGQGP